MLNFSATQIRDEPYPLVVLRPARDPALYSELSERYPDVSLFGTHPKYGYKLSLSEKFMKENYNRFIAETRSWNRFHAWLHSVRRMTEKGPTALRKSVTIVIERDE